MKIALIILICIMAIGIAMLYDRLHENDKYINMLVQTKKELNKKNQRLEYQNEILMKVARELAERIK